MSLRELITDQRSNITDFDIDSPGVDDGEMFELCQSKIVVNFVVIAKGLEGEDLFQLSSIAVDYFQ